MEAYKRRQAIQALLRDTGEIEIDDLAQRLGVSPNSIRNDLDSLAAEGQLSRLRGGAISLEANTPSRAAFTVRTGVQRREKEAIGRWPLAWSMIAKPPWTTLPGSSPTASTW